MGVCIVKHEKNEENNKIYCKVHDYTKDESGILNAVFNDGIPF